MPRCLQPLLQLTQFSEELELQRYQNKFAKMFISNLAVQQQSQITSSPRGSDRHQYAPIQFNMKNSAILTTYAAFPRYKHIWPVGSPCVWLYSVKPQVATSTHFPVTKPVVISWCDCIMRLAACMCLMLLEARLQLAVNALKLQARSGSMLFLPVQPGGWICTQLKEVVVAYLSQALVVHDKIRPAG